MQEQITRKGHYTINGVEKTLTVDLVKIPCEDGSIATLLKKNAPSWKPIDEQEIESYLRYKQSIASDVDMDKFPLMDTYPQAECVKIIRDFFEKYSSNASLTYKVELASLKLKLDRMVSPSKKNDEDTSSEYPQLERTFKHTYDLEI